MSVNGERLRLQKLSAPAGRHLKDLAPNSESGVAGFQLETRLPEGTLLSSPLL